MSRLYSITSFTLLKTKDLYFWTRLSTVFTRVLFSFWNLEFTAISIVPELSRMLYLHREFSVKEPMKCFKVMLFHPQILLRSRKPYGGMEEMCFLAETQRTQRMKRILSPRRRDRRE